MSLTGHVLHLKNGRLTAANPRPAVDAIAREAVEGAGEGGIVIHFHGGLVSEAAGRRTAERLLARYEVEGKAHPIFFVWESGLLETVGNNLGEILREPFFKRVLKRSLEFVLRKFVQHDGQRSAGVLPPVETDVIDEAVERAAEHGDASALEAMSVAVPDDLGEIGLAEQLVMEEELNQDIVLSTAIAEISNGMRDPADVLAGVGSRSATVRGSATTLMDPEALEEMIERPDPGSRGILSTGKVVAAVVKVVAAVVGRYRSGRDHGLHATVVEEILRAFYLGNVGGYVWRLIKKDTLDAFDDDGQTAGGTALLEALAARIDPAHPPRITLVGHSTGAVYISHFLDKAARILPDTVRYGVVFLAPASTFTLTSGTLEAHAGRLSGFRMFTMTDAYERQDRLVPALYPHSLLYFVSGVVEEEPDTPIVGLQRFYDRERYPPPKFGEIEKTRTFMEGVADRAVWSISSPGGAGRATSARNHGAFDDDEDTLRSVAHILATGFDA